MCDTNKPKQPKFTLAFKQDAARLAIEKGYTHQQAADSLGCRTEVVDFELHLGQIYSVGNLVNLIQFAHRHPVPNIQQGSGDDEPPVVRHEERPAARLDYVQAMDGQCLQAFDVGVGQQVRRVGHGR